MGGLGQGGLKGGRAGWYWQDQIRVYADHKTRGVRNGAADTLRAGEKRAEDVLDRTKGQLSWALQAGQEAGRPRTRAALGEVIPDPSAWPRRHLSGPPRT